MIGVVLAVCCQGIELADGMPLLGLDLPRELVMDVNKPGPGAAPDRAPQLPGTWSRPMAWA